MRLLYCGRQKETADLSTSLLVFKGTGFTGCGKTLWKSRRDG
jgi:hypothetical protein